MKTMTKNNKSSALICGLIIAIVTFATFFLSIKYILKTSLLPTNIIAFIILSFIVGLISFGLYLLKPKIAFSLFLAGMIAGFFIMISSYMKDMDGWGDLIGLMTFFMFALIGLASGLIIQIVVYLINKNKKH